MPRYTRSYSGLIERLREVDILRRDAAAKARVDPIGNVPEINALCRGSMVLLCSHLEAYVRQLGELALGSLVQGAVSREHVASSVYYHISSDFIRDVGGIADHGKAADRVFDFLARDSAYWSREGSFPVAIDADRFSKGFSNPKFKKIRAYFNRFGYQQYRHDLATRLRADFSPLTNAVDHLVDTRHQIAHGDSSATKTPSEVRELALMVRRFSAATDAVFATWWGERFRSIR